MRMPVVQAGERPLPAPARSRLAGLALSTKIGLLQAQRLAAWTLRPQAFARAQRAAPGSWPHAWSQIEAPIGRSDASAHPALEAGKRVNLALAARAFESLLLRTGEPFSFWRTLGRVSQARGFRPGLEISGGCLRPAIGGGLCLLSNALFELAVRAGLVIHERHGHTQEAAPPPPGALWGLDATVFWPYVDLRFEARAPSRLAVSISGDTLRLRLESERPMLHRVELAVEGERLQRTAAGMVRENRVVRRIRPLDSDALLEESLVAENRRRLLSPEEMGRTCYTCGEDGCHRRVEER